MSAGLDPALGCVLRLSLAILFAAAAAHKLRDPVRFRATLSDYRLLPEPLVAAMARALGAIEATLSIALLLPASAAGAAWAGAALLSLYGLAIAVNLLRGRHHVACGCLGPAAEQPLRGALVLRNALLVGAAVLAAQPLHVRALSWLDAVTVLGGAAVLALLYLAVDALLASRPALEVRT